MASSDEDIKIIPGTKFVVDGFKLKKEKNKYQHFFLTHFHSDHYAGLIKTWSHGMIYCTIPTCNLVKKKFNVKEEYLYPCEFNKTYKVEDVEFAFLDANHCPGSSLILFKVNSTGKAFLHTGDMRFDRSKMLNCEALRPYIRSELLDDGDNEEEKDGCNGDKKKNMKLESIFLDTTYCDPFYTFPKQVEAIEFISNIIEMKLKDKKKKYLILIGTYQIGKERIAEGIYKKTKKKVFVTFDKYKTLQCLNLPYFDAFTMNVSETNVHIVNMKDIGWKRLFQIRAANKDVDEIIAIKPSAWCFSEMEIPPEMPKDGIIPTVAVNATRRSNITQIEVPYSEHSSFSELKECIDTFYFKDIIPTVYKDKKHKKRILEMLDEGFNYQPITIKLGIPEVVLTENEASNKTSSKKKKEEEKPKVTIFDFIKKGEEKKKKRLLKEEEEKKAKEKVKEEEEEIDEETLEELAEVMNEIEYEEDGVIVNSSYISSTCRSKLVNGGSSVDNALDIDELDDDDFVDGSQLAVLMSSTTRTPKKERELKPIVNTSNPFLKLPSTTESNTTKNNSTNSIGSSSCFINKKTTGGSSTNSSSSTAPKATTNETPKAKLRLKRKQITPTPPTPSTPSFNTNNISNTKKQKFSSPSSVGNQTTKKSIATPQQKNTILSYLYPLSKETKVKEINENGITVLSIEDDE
ncbi:hypothetical protein ABK040_005227 [Willaertia magna]